MESGQVCYYRRVRIDLEGGPGLNVRDDNNEMKKRRAKMSSKQSWFRKRGGESAKEQKDQGWRMPNGGLEPRVRREDPHRTGRRPRHKPETSTTPTTAPRDEPRRVVSTLLVPYTVGSTLKDSMQRAEDMYTEVLQVDRVRIVEKGGDSLINLLGRNDPWGSRRTCSDPKCPACQSRKMLQELKKDAKKSGAELPKGLIVKTSPQCRREGQNYGAQCLECVLGLGRTQLLPVTAIYDEILAGQSRDLSLHFHLCESCVAETVHSTTLPPITSPGCCA